MKDGSTTRSLYNFDWIGPNTYKWAFFLLLVNKNIQIKYLFNDYKIELSYNKK